MTKHSKQKTLADRLTQQDFPSLMRNIWKKYLDITPGSVSIMGLMNDTDNNVQLLMDKEVLEDEVLGCHPCINTSSLKLKTREVLDKFLPAVHHEAIIVELPRYED